MQKYSHVVDGSVKWSCVCVCVCVCVYAPSVGSRSLQTHDTIFRKGYLAIYINMFNVYTFDPDILGIYLKKTVTNLCKREL